MFSWQKANHKRPKPLSSGCEGMTSRFDEAVAAGDASRGEKNWLEAVSFYREALKTRPEVLEISVQLGHALKESGDYTGAEAAYRVFLGANPDDADIHLQMGHLYAKQNAFDLALGWYLKARDLDGANADISHHVEVTKITIESTATRAQRSGAMALTEAQRWTEARSALLDLVEGRGCVDLVGILANVCKEVGRFDEAERYYARYREYAATASSSQHYDALLQSGHFEKSRGDYSRALDYFIRAKRLLGPSLSGEDRGEASVEITVCLRQICPVLAR